MEINYYSKNAIFMLFITTFDIVGALTLRPE